ncbi:conserved membrane hypothetical protein [Candidatus Accumulibacter aalborgensis]|uniref:DUF2868 domain-containing protein n=1 Tax=Candidatus Accumulibacter aalborgensis TaxID=1860102 RepID=A0A1A8XZA9_9PROT|nr:DUF2868 domain-containing protein [Candidatus Accumulibacter aalborgensis]SBT10046.1 conserved membrane hypothetical protein [Candidatus Accumulibacter aalborgensis]
MNERDALLTTALRAVETVDGDRRLWTDDDRSWSSRAAAEVVGAGASPAVFVARRAHLAFERLASRDAGFVRAVAGLRWRAGIGMALIVLAFLAGVATDHLGSGQRINLLALPILGLLAWNLLVYLSIAAGWLRRQGRTAEETVAVRRFLVRGATGMGGWLRQRGMRMPKSVLVRLVGDWSRIAAALYAARAARILHLAATLFALGIIAGFYFRGLAFEYRAGWESTFLGAEAVHRILTLMLAPGAWLVGEPLPSVDALAAIRFGALPPTENAALWLHRMAATIVIVVVVPRLVLGLASAVRERQRSTRLIGHFDDPYFQRLLRDYQVSPARLTVIPYSYHPLPATLAGLQAVLARVFGSSAAMLCTAPVSYGDESALPSATQLDGSGPSCALFSLAATPERETQGAFVRALQASGNGAPVLVFVDEGPWRARFDADGQRLAERRSAWRAEFADLGVAPIFVDLAQPDLAAAQSEIEHCLQGVA